MFYLYLNRSGCKTDPQADVTRSESEGQIDELVYRLYGLTEDEVKIVEGKK